MSDKENEQIDLDNSNVSANADCTGGCHGDNKNARRFARFMGWVG